MANFLFILSKGSNEGATRCFQFAKVAKDKGHEVEMFLVDDGVMWADKNRDLSQRTTTGDSPGDYLPSLIKAEVPCGV